MQHFRPQTFRSRTSMALAAASVAVLAQRVIEARLEQRDDQGSEA